MSDQLDPAARDSLIAAGRAVVEANRAVDQARKARDAAFVAIHKAGVGTTKVWQVARDVLVNAGFTTEEIGIIGVSDPTVRTAIRYSR